MQTIPTLSNEIQADTLEETIYAVSFTLNALCVYAKQNDLPAKIEVALNDAHNHILRSWEMVRVLPS